mgnify:CR=1 FL=1
MQVRILARDEIESDKLARLAREVAAELHVAVHVERGSAEVLPTGQRVAMPALLLDGELKSAGRMPVYPPSWFTWLHVASISTT